MGLTIEDLKPKSFKITVKGVELECSPLRLSHALTVAKLGEVFQNSKDATKAQIAQAEVDMDEVISELIPELKGINLDISSVIEIITLMMETIQPSDNKELDEQGVDISNDPKAPKIG